MTHPVRGPGSVAIVALALAIAACAPSAPPSPTAALPKPAPPAAPAAQPAATAAPAAKPAATAAPAPTAAPAAKPAAKVDTKAIEDFYKGKTVRILVGYAAGGPYDIFSRVVSRYMPKYIPGGPSIIVENRAGAASLLVANQVYGSELKDGTVIGSFSSGTPLLQALGKEGVEFDVLKYNWLGSGSKTVSTCAARVDSGVKTIQDIMGPNAKELPVAAIGPGTGTYDTPITLNAVIGTKFKVISGYAGTSVIVGAVERREVDGMCANLDTMHSSVRQLLDGPNPIQKFIVVMGAKTPDDPWLKGVPPSESLVKTEEEKQILRAAALATVMNLPYGVAPEVPKERVEALRKALADTFADPQFRADAEKAGFEVNPNSGEELARVVQDAMKMQPGTLAKLKEILK
ncbi:MAG: hypothetical protein HY690_16875 [Chloroflexi bacterium]|nr:hypothetical protein [Chloroflexota bacterium]